MADVLCDVNCDVSAIFFDLDNTLIQTRKGDTKACNKVSTHWHNRVFDIVSRSPFCLLSVYPARLTSINRARAICQPEPTNQPPPAVFFTSLLKHAWKKTLALQYNRLKIDLS